MDDRLAARSQMALSLGFHIIFASIGMAMPFLIFHLGMALLVGSALILPALAYLLRVFKSETRELAGKKSPATWGGAGGARR